MDIEQIDLDYDDLDNKLNISDLQVFNQLYIPMMAISNNDNSPVSHNFLKMFFRLEKVNDMIPNTNENTPILVLFYYGSSKTVGNQQEHLDSYDDIQATDIILCSLNGIDRSQKRVCKITILGHSGKQIPF